MSSDLKKQGAMRKKTLRLKFPVLPNRLIRHFVRGYFDGDGCVCVARKRNRATLSIVGCRPLLSQMKTVMNDMGVSFIYLYRHSKKTSYLAVTHTEGLVQACRFLYGDGGIYLERKANKFREFFSRKGMQWPA
jgi:intein/homing endonuclease